jgi:DOMON domain
MACRVLTKVKVLVVAALLVVQSGANVIWDHSVYLDENFLLKWTVKEPDILFEAQVKAHGYVGIGFSRDGSTIYGADLVIGWLDEGFSFFYVSKLHVQSAIRELVSLSNHNLHVIVLATPVSRRGEKRTSKDTLYVLLPYATQSVCYYRRHHAPRRCSHCAELLSAHDDG